MGSSECCCFIKWLCCCFNAADQNLPASFENKVSNLPASFESKVSNAATDQIISSPFTEEETTLEHLDKVLADIKGQLDRLERAADHSSRISLSWVNYKGQITSFMQTLPTSFTSEVAETSKTLLMQLLGGLGGLHWTAIGFSLIAWSLETMDTSAQNWKDCLQLLRTIVSLLENTRKIWQASPEDDDLKVLQDSVEIAFQCAIICSSMMQGGGPKHRLLRLLKASSIQASIDNLKRDLDRAFEQIRTHIEVVRFVEAPRLQRQYTYSHIDGIVGGDEVRKKAMAHLNRDGSQLVAVFLQGMGGIGKSTFGMAIFSEFQKKISPQGMSQYRCCCVELPLGIAKEKGLQKFQKQILDKLCRHGTPEISSLKDGVFMLKKELEKLREPVFLYLDNVLDPMKEEHWLPEAQSFPKGSRILVTTRHEHVCKALARRLKIWDYKCIKVEKLDEQQSKELLWRQLQQDDSQHAWHSPNAEMEMLEREVLELCDGLPLALTVVGRYIANSEDGPRVAKVWKGAIEAMRRAESLDGDAEDELYSRMRVSIDLLDSEIRKAFLDVVAYAVGWPWSTAERLVSTRRLEVLCQRALVEQTSLGSNVEVQDVLKTMGLRMVADDKEEIRIRGQADFDDTTSRNALEKVVGLMDVMVEAEQLQQMPRLRCLRNVKIEGDCKRGAKLRHLLVCEMSGDTARPFDVSACIALKELSWFRAAANVWDLEALEWMKVSQQLEMLTIQGWVGLVNVDAIVCLHSLKGLHIRNCGSLQSLSEGVASWTGLTSLQLSGCRNLQSLPEGVASWRGLRSLQLSGCRSLQSLPEGAASWTDLTSLDLSGCGSLQSLPEGAASWQSLMSLDLSRSGSLQSLSEGAASWVGLTSLDLCGCDSLQSLPEGVASWTGLTSLDLSECGSLESLPEGVACWTGLTSLDLSLCGSLRSLPEGVASWTGLTSLDLSWCGSLKALPEGVASWTGLTSLQMFGCRSLQSLPEGVASWSGLRSLDLCGCGSLQSLPEGVASWMGLRSLDLFGCGSLQSLPEGVASWTGLTSLDLSWCSSLQSLPVGVASWKGLMSLQLSGCRSLQSLLGAAAS